MDLGTLVDLRLLRADGTPWRAAQELVRSGGYVPVLRSVLVRADAVDDPIVRARAVALVLPDGAAVCRETAAWLHGIDVRPPGQHRQPPALQCVVPRGVVRRRRPGLQCRVANLPPDDVLSVHGVPTTTASRTALDLARYAPPHLGLAALDGLAHQGAVTVDEVMGRAHRLAGARNIARARELITLCEPATESAGESWLRLRLVQAGLPRPVPQISIRDERGREVYRLDLGYPDVCVGVEYDGDAFHHATAGQQAHDERRRDDLQRRFGWDVVGVGRGDVLGPSNRLERAVAAMIRHDGVVLARQQW